MTSSAARSRRAEIAYDDACALLEQALEGTTRHEILDAAQSTRGFRAAITRLRAGMQAHTFPAGDAPLALQRVVRHLDHRTRAEGFHVLQSWDYRAHRFVDDITPVLLLDRVAGSGAPPADERNALSTLLDQYFLTILGLLVVRAWDEGDANANFDRVTRILALLNGPDGSGHRIVDNSELLLLLAIAQYHPKEGAYDLLLSKVQDLDTTHRGNVALVCAASLGSHLRWGFRFMYDRDHVRMRDDNVVDYPWLLFSVATLVDTYCCMRDGRRGELDRDTVVAGVTNALTADPWAFTGEPPASLESHRATHATACEQLASCKLELLAEAERQRPDTTRYSPLGFECNFLNNVVVAMVETVAGEMTAHPSLDALLTTQRPETTPSPMSYARRLTRYAGLTAARAGGHALVVYDPYDGRERFDVAVRTLRGE